MTLDGPSRTAGPATTYRATADAMSVCAVTLALTPDSPGWIAASSPANEISTGRVIFPVQRCAGERSGSTFVPNPTNAPDASTTDAIRKR